MMRTQTLCLASLACLLGLGALAGCTRHGQPAMRAAETEPPDDWRQWRAERHRSVYGPDGWATLIGLHWLGVGATTVGAHPTNQVVLPSLPGVPAFLGVFTITPETIRFVPQASAAARAAATALPLLEPAPAPMERPRGQAEQPWRMSAGRLTVEVIQRGERVGLRLRNPAAPACQDPPPLPYFPYRVAWRVPAQFEAFSTPRTLRVADVTGGSQTFVSPGILHFRVGGQACQLDVAEEPGRDTWFILFRDATAGQGLTYPSGRFLAAAKADTAGRTVLDFNRAYSPPCAFTEFATCPKTPSQNELSCPIPAGERYRPHP